MSHVATVIANKMWKASPFASIRGNQSMKRQSIAAGMFAVADVCSLLKSRFLVLVLRCTLSSHSLLTLCSLSAHSLLTLCSVSAHTLLSVCALSVVGGSCLYLLFHSAFV